jgi:hypothetical protein
MIRGMDIAVQVGIQNPRFHLVSSRRREAAKKNELLLLLGFHATIVEVVQVFGDTGFVGRLLSMHYDRTAIFLLLRGVLEKKSVARAGVHTVVIPLSELGQVAWPADGLLGFQFGSS